MPRSKKSPKTEFLQIRITEEEQERIQQAADAEFLDKSTWARKVILEAVQRLENCAETPMLRKKKTK